MISVGNQDTKRSVFQLIITFFLAKKSNGSAGSAGSTGFAGSGGSTVC